MHVLKLAREMGVLKVGTVSVDGTHLDANASKSKNVRYDRAVALEKQLRLDIDDLIRKAEAADADETADGQSLPEEIARRRLLEKMKEAQANLKARAEAKAAAEREAYQRKIEQQEDGPRRGPKPQEPENKGPQPTDQANLTDDDSRLMRKNRRAEYRQAYNAQAVVDAEGSQLILAEHVTNCANDVNELEPAVQGVDPTVGKPSAVLADCGYGAWRRGWSGPVSSTLTCPVTSEYGNSERRYDFRPPSEKKPRAVTDPRLVAMQTKMESKEARRRYAKRKQTVEPVFGIIKAVMGFTASCCADGKGRREMEPRGLGVHLQAAAQARTAPCRVTDIRWPRAHPEDVARPREVPNVTRSLDPTPATRRAAVGRPTGDRTAAPP